MRVECETKLNRKHVLGIANCDFFAANDETTPFTVILAVPIPEDALYNAVLLSKNSIQSKIGIAQNGVLAQLVAAGGLRVNDKTIFCAGGCGGVMLREGNFEALNESRGGVRPDNLCAGELRGRGTRIWGIRTHEDGKGIDSTALEVYCGDF